jgi:hypothetical protein
MHIATESHAGAGRRTLQQTESTTRKGVLEALDRLHSLLLQMVSTLSGECRNPVCMSFLSRFYDSERLKQHDYAKSATIVEFPSLSAGHGTDAPGGPLPPFAPAAALEDVLKALEQLRRRLTCIIKLCE